MNALVCVDGMWQTSLFGAVYVIKYPTSKVCARLIGSLLNFVQVVRNGIQKMYRGM